MKKYPLPTNCTRLLFILSLIHIFVRFNSDSDNVEKELDYFDFYFRGHPFQTAYKINNLAGWIAAIKNGKGVGLIDSIVTGARSKCKTWFEDIAILPVTD